MAASFGINAVIITDEQLQGEIDAILDCLKKSGISIPSKIDEPGIAALIKTLVRSIEKSIVTSFEPIIALVNVVIESLDAGVNAISVFLEKIIKVVDGITELLAELPLSLIEFIVNKLLEPIVNNINIPFPGITAIMDILTLKVSIAEIDWKKWLDDGKIIIPDSLKKRGNDEIEKVLTLFNKVEGFKQPAFTKILELLIFPIKLTIGILESVVKKVTELTTNLIDAVNEITEIASNPVKWVIDFIAETFADVLETVIKKFIPIEIPDPKVFADKFKELIMSLFKIGAKKIDIDKWIEELPAELKPIFEKIVGFVKMIQCIIMWIASLLKPATILGLFNIDISKIKLPPAKIKEYIASSRTIVIEKMTASDLLKFIKTNDEIKIVSSLGTRESVVERVNGLNIIIRSDPFGKDFKDGTVEKK